MLQGGPHIHQIAGVATQLKEAQTPEFKTYIQQVKKNSSALAAELTALGHDITSGGTDNHLFLWDLRKHGLSGAKMEKACELAGITLNKNTIVGDESAMTPGGVRIGMSAMTTRGVDEAGCKVIASLLDRVCKQGLAVQAKVSDASGGSYWLVLALPFFSRFLDLYLRLGEMPSRTCSPPLPCRSHVTKPIPPPLVMAMVQVGKKLVDYNPAIEADPVIVEIAKEVADYVSSFPMPGVEPTR